MTEFSIKTEDSLPVFQTTLDKDISGNSEVRIYVEKASSNTLVVNDTMTVNDATTGDVEYDFSASQTAREGFHLAEVVVNYGGNDVESFPKEGFYTFKFNETVNRSANVEPAEASGTLQVSNLITEGNIEDDLGNLIYDYSASHIEQSILENDSVTIAGNTVSLGGSTSIAVADLTGDTDGLSEGTTNLYYTDERAQDAIGTIVSAQFTYDDAANLLNIDPHANTTDAHHTRYSDAEAESAINNDADHGSTASHNYTTDTRTDVSDDGTTVVSEVTDINFGTNASVTDDADGTVTVDTTDTDTNLTTEEVQDIVGPFVTGAGNITVTYDDANDTLTVDTSALNTEEVEDAVNALLTTDSNLTLTYDDANDTLTVGLASAVNVGTLSVGGSTALQSVAASGQATLSSGTAVVDTALSTADATFYLALGIDDPNADAKVTGRLFWDDSAGTYKIEIVEDGTSIGNPTINYDVLRVR